MFILNLREKYTVGLQSCKWVNKASTVIFQSIADCQESAIIIPTYSNSFKSINILLFAKEFTRKPKAIGKDNGKILYRLLDESMMIIQTFR